MPCEQLLINKETMDHIAVLLVEDNPEDILLIRKYLAEERNYRFECFEVRSLKGALDLLPHYDFDAVLVDLNLPDSAGFDTVRKITTQLPDTAVIILTGLQDDEIALQAVRYGAQDFIEKSQLIKPTLSKSIRYAIERKKVHQEKEDLLVDLNHALHHIELLESLLPLCISCKKILGTDNNWYSLQNFSNRVATKHSHDPICPECQTSFPPSRGNDNRN